MVRVMLRSSGLESAQELGYPIISSGSGRLGTNYQKNPITL